MSSSSLAPGAAPAAVPDGAGAGAAGDTRARVAGAAFELFAAQGYDNTTVDAIAERAGIARRTFFRYFRSKDDVIFPDHDSLLESVRTVLDDSAERSPVEALCEAVRPVLNSYVDDARVSVQRYRLTRSVTALRDRELSSVRRYERLFSQYVRERLVGMFGEVDAALRADVIAASVVAAHNAVLREWLRAGGTYDPTARLNAAFAWVAGTMATSVGDPASVGRDETGVVVAVFRSDQPIDDVVQRISRSL
jgi:AcrR family transcriptional regulator